MAKKTVRAPARKSYARRSYRKGATIRRPYGGSRYGNDAFVKVETIEPLGTQAGIANNVFSTMRVNSPSVSVGNSYLGQQTEFQNFQKLYARYEVSGMKAEVTLNARYAFSEANIVGGLSPSLPNPAVFPTQEQTLTYPRQVDCNVQGEVTTLYYSYSKDLKNSGATFARGTTEAYPAEDQGIIQVKAVGDIPAGTAVGSVKFTWYVRFHGRTRNQGLTTRSDPFRKVDIPKNVPQEAAESMMSYADLQA